MLTIETKNFCTRSSKCMNTVFVISIIKETCLKPFLDQFFNC